jgi:hypothetical protein
MHAERRRAIFIAKFYTYIRRKEITGSVSGLTGDLPIKDTKRQEIKKISFRVFLVFRRPGLVITDLLGGGGFLGMMQNLGRWTALFRRL